LSFDEVVGQEAAVTALRAHIARTGGQGSTLIYVTHSRELAARADQVWEIHSGQLDIG